jgi:type VI secretion system protein ImpL
VGDLVSELGTRAQAASRSGLRTNLLDRYLQEVVSYCQDVVRSRYPFSPASNDDVPVADFGALFGHDGTFDTFFKQNLVELVNTAPSTWVWREDASGASVGLSQNVLRQFQLAKTIRDMFFPVGSKMPNVTFNLTIQRIDPPTPRAVRFELDGKSVVYQYGPQRPEAFTWPSESPRGAAVTFEERTGPPISIATSGAWALFKLLEQGNPRQLASERFELTFQKSGRTTTMTLDASSVRNPFARRAFLQQFRCGV